ncbi:uncharacterized protein LOC125256624 [Megalobrama amblycephala]|uniref:uncharacterized protein LOC125256624 n=1 Tax=Megalobrama amblycephala TaxID=75352 RepID=UPI002014710C|nr:uncharacterized protein LOC125256624 [Megalobrama amblycephala]
MSGNRELSYRGHEEESDEEYDRLYTKNINTKLTISSDINKELLKRETWEFKKDITQKPKVKLASVDAKVSNIIDMIDTYDRPGNTKAEGTYAGAGTYAEAFEDEPGKRIPKAGAYAEAGVGRARAELSVLEAEAKGPNASAGAEASLTGVAAMARAEIASASARAGPVGAKLGLGFDTGVSAGVDGLEAKILGTGFSFGPKTSVSFLGSEVSCVVM